MDWSDWTLILGELNYWAILVASLAGGMGVGTVWYSKRVFGGTWQNLVGLKDKDLTSSKANKAMGGAFVLTLITAWALAVLEYVLSVDTWLEGLNFGLFIGLLIVSTGWLVNNLFEQRPLRLWKINAGYATINLAVMAVILAIWR